MKSKDFRRDSDSFDDWRRREVMKWKNSTESYLMQRQTPLRKVSRLYPSLICFKNDEDFKVSGLNDDFCSSRKCAEHQLRETERFKKISDVVDEWGRIGLFDKLEL